MQIRDEQESFWAGSFGSEYVGRNQDDSILTSNIALFTKVMGRLGKIKSVIEYGANIGLNLQAIKILFPELEFSAVEINPDAVQTLKKYNWLKTYHQSIFEFTTQQTYDFTFVKGVLIHINPDSLNKAYDLLYHSSDKYIMIAEYYNPSPVTIEYRGHKNKLFKRDFCGEMLKRFNDLKLVDYGFCYHRDPCYPQDDITWFLLEKKRDLR